MSELTKRVLFAFPAAILFIWITWLGGWYFYGLMAGIGLLIQREVLDLADQSGLSANKVFTYLFGIWVLILPLYPQLIISGLLLLILVIGYEILGGGEYTLQHIVTTPFYGIYAPLGMGSLIYIRSMGTGNTGLFLTVTVLLLVWFNDIFSYFGGKYFGTHAMAPQTSPNKTWEGFGFGFLGALLGLLLPLYTVSFPLSIGWALPMFLISSIAGPIGDLMESKMKREASVKDSSDILPGHGGLFDRFDALILVSISLLLYLKAVQWLTKIPF